MTALAPAAGAAVGDGDGDDLLGVGASRSCGEHAASEGVDEWLLQPATSTAASAGRARIATCPSLIRGAHVETIGARGTTAGRRSQGFTSRIARLVRGGRACHFSAGEACSGFLALVGRRRRSSWLRGLLVEPAAGAFQGDPRPAVAGLLQVGAKRIPGQRAAALPPGHPGAAGADAGQVTVTGTVRGAQVTSRSTRTCASRRTLGKSGRRCTEPPSKTGRR